MEEKIYTIEAQYNKHNFSVCELYKDRIVLKTVCTGGLIPVYENKEREILIRDIKEIVVSNGGMHFFQNKPNAIHFITDENQRSLNTLFRDSSFPARKYIDEGVQQLCPKNEQDLSEKLALARKIKAYVEENKGS